MTEEAVYVIDRVVTKAGCAKAFVDAYRADYAPGARERGMVLERVLVSPPMWFDDESNTVTITWTLDGVDAWWQMTWQGRSDALLGRWWTQIDHLVASRSRSFASLASDVEALSNV